MLNNISFITAHFYDFEWTELLINNIKKYSDPELIKEILVINQDRNSESRDQLKKIDPSIRVVEYPKSLPHFKTQGHDHAAVLNFAVHDAVGDYICVFDSDAHPISNKWIESCERILQHYDAILALVPGTIIDTHPCFMLIKKNIANFSISFDEDLFSRGVDTGRLVGIQLIEAGQKVFFLAPTTTFYGSWGNIYLDTIYHHKSASYSGANDERLRQQVNWRNNYFKELVIKKRQYEFTFSEYVRYKILNTIYKRIIMRYRKIMSNQK